MDVDRLPTAGLATVDRDQVLAGFQQLGRGRIELVELKLGDEACESRGFLTVDKHVSIFVVMDQQGGLGRHGVEGDGPSQPDLRRIPGGADTGPRCRGITEAAEAGFPS